ncbi:hypothetical protein J6590_069440 [Homalodisca vitripennis]|nr:hypothetical protein J6590_069440 [Homalodisca vitripennis]
MIALKKPANKVGAGAGEYKTEWQDFMKVSIFPGSSSTKIRCSSPASEKLRCLTLLTIQTRPHSSFFSLTKKKCQHNVYTSSKAFADW